MTTIVDIATESEGFSTLVAAVDAAGLIDTLQSPGPFTVFAPTDEAFARLPAGTIDTLLQNIPQLTRILKYHVVAGRLKQADLVGMNSVTSLEGTSIPIGGSEEFEVKNASVLSADIEATNGVIHVVDRVLLMG